MHRSIRCLAATSSLLLLASAAGATVTSGNASASGVSLDLSALLVNVDVGPIPVAQVSSPAPDTDSNILLDISALSPLLSSGTAEVNASSNVDGASGARNAAADATIEGLGLNIGSLLALGLSIQSTDIFSSASVNGNYGGFVGSGDANFTNTSIKINNVTFNIDPNPAPNTVVFDSLGIFVIVNEQIFGGNGVDGRSLTVNAIRIAIDPLSLGALQGDIVLAQSHADLSGTVVPEPTTATLLGIGLLGFAVRARRRVRA